MADILTALREYIRTGKDIPTPSDLIAIIDPPEQELSAAMYVELKKRSREGDYLYGSERRFVEAFEAKETAKAREGSDRLRQAQADIENHFSGQLAYHGPHFIDQGEPV